MREKINIINKHKELKESKDIKVGDYVRISNTIGPYFKYNGIIMKVTKIKERSCICNNPTCIETNSEKIYYAKPLLSQVEYTISTCWCKMRKVKKNKITYKDIRI